MAHAVASAGSVLHCSCPCTARRIPEQVELAGYGAVDQSPWLRSHEPADTTNSQSPGISFQSFCADCTDLLPLLALIILLLLRRQLHKILWLVGKDGALHACIHADHLGQGNVQATPLRAPSGGPPGR